MVEKKSHGESGSSNNDGDNHKRNVKCWCGLKAIIRTTKTSKIQGQSFWWDMDMEKLRVRMNALQMELKIIKYFIFLLFLVMVGLRVVSGCWIVWPKFDLILFFWWICELVSKLKNAFDIISYWWKTYLSVNIMLKMSCQQWSLHSFSL